MKSLLSFVIAITMLCLLGCSSDEPKGLNDIALSTDACVTCNASDIKTTSAMLNGNINYDAISGDRLGVMKYGFIISTNNEPTAENGQVLYASNISSNVYSICAKNLAPEEQYYYVSFFYDA